MIPHAQLLSLLEILTPELHEHFLYCAHLRKALVSLENMQTSTQEELKLQTAVRPFVRFFVKRGIRLKQKRELQRLTEDLAVVTAAHVLANRTYQKVQVHLWAHVHAWLLIRSPVYSNSKDITALTAEWVRLVGQATTSLGSLTTQIREIHSTITGLTDLTTANHSALRAVLDAAVTLQGLITQLDDVAKQSLGHLPMLAPVDFAHRLRTITDLPCARVRAGLESISSDCEKFGFTFSNAVAGYTPFSRVDYLTEIIAAFIDHYCQHRFVVSEADELLAQAELRFGGLTDEQGEHKINANCSNPQVQT